ncbi:CRISPR-associated endonuclease Cas1 [Lachnospiraceae bacterium KK002]
MVQCLKRGINISYYSKGGSYFSRLQSTNHINVQRQRKQAALADSEFSLELAKNIVSGKIHNQEIILRRYARSEEKDVKDNPYFGFIHSDREKHPTLASDMMEEWRATLVDSLVMSLVNGHEIHTEHFFHNRDQPGYYLTTEGMNIFLKKYEKKMQTATQYLDYIDYAVTFRQAIDLQINELTKAIENEDASLYHPIWLR